MAIVTQVPKGYINIDFATEVTVGEYVHVKSVHNGEVLNDTMYNLGKLSWVEQIEDFGIGLHYDNGVQFYITSHIKEVVTGAYDEAYKYLNSDK